MMAAQPPRHAGCTWPAACTNLDINTLLVMIIVKFAVRSISNPEQSHARVEKEIIARYNNLRLLLYYTCKHRTTAIGA
jgi:hypothetical protein